MTTKRRAKTCDNCLHGARFSVTGVISQTTLKMDMGGAVLYVMPGNDGEITITLNTQNLVDGNYAVAVWDGKTWIIQKN